MSEPMRMATATEVQNNFGKYLQFAIDSGEVVILRNGKRVARLVSDTAAVSYLTDSLRGVLRQDYSEEEARAERMKKYENID